MAFGTPEPLNALVHLNLIYVRLLIYMSVAVMILSSHWKSCCACGFNRFAVFFSPQIHHVVFLRHITTVAVPMHRTKKPIRI